MRKCYTWSDTNAKWSDMQVIWSDACVTIESVGGGGITPPQYLLQDKYKKKSTKVTVEVIVEGIKYTHTKTVNRPRVMLESVNFNVTRGDDGKPSIDIKIDED